MNEEGEFVCDEHKPPQGPGQWWVQAEEIQVKCDHCEKAATWYVLSKQ